jgi:serine/threonine-protein kinase
LSPEARQRFLNEAAITGQLEHPGIVPIYTVEDDGAEQPFYVMRFVEGKTLAAAIRECHEIELPEGRSSQRRDPSFQSPRFRNLLQRFMSVCNTVAYAHSKHVIHRDLKPSNIMLGEYGETLVLDWGLAKVLDGSTSLTASGPVSLPPNPESLLDSFATGDLTEVGQIMGTPAYMSPEQARGDAVGTSTDLWSLGAILYEMLTGRPPFVGQAREVLDELGVKSPPAPHLIRPAVPRDLEAVCLRALSRIPQERYFTPTALAADIDRWLADEPVSARPESWGARSRRWMKRHRTLAAATAAAVFVGLIVLAIATVRLTAANQNLETANARERSARARTDRSYQLARGSLTEVMKLRSDRRFQQGPFEDVKLALLRAEAAFYRQFIELRGDDRAFQLEQALAFLNLCQLTREMGGEPSEALRHGVEAIRLFDVLLEQEPDNVDYLWDRARASDVLGSLYEETAQPDRALAAYDEALRGRHRVQELEPSPTNLVEMARGIGNRGMLLKRVSRLPEAEAALEEAKRLLVTVVAQQPRDADSHKALAQILNNQGLLFWLLKRPSESLACLEEALRIHLRIKEEFPSDSEHTHALVGAYDNVATLHLQLKRYADALRYAKDARALAEQLAKEHPLIVEYQHALGLQLNNLGSLYFESGQTTESREHHQRSIAMLEGLHERFPQVTSYAHSLAIACHCLARIEGFLGTAQESVRLQDRAIGLLDAVLAVEPRHSGALAALPDALNNRALIQIRLQRFDSAIRDFQRSRLAAVPSTLPVFFWRVAHQGLRRQLIERIQKGEVRPALEIVRSFQAAPDCAGETLVMAAAVYAAAEAGDKSGTHPPGENAAKAVALLRKAMDAGHFKDPEVGESFLKDRDFDQLRERPDFKKLVESLAKK